MTQQNLLEAFNSAPYTCERVEKNGMMDIVYSFTDEQNHDYRYHFEKRVNYGRNVFVVTLGQKAPSLKMYKRVFGRFANPLRVIATLIDIVKDVRKTRHDVKGLIIEVPEQAFGSHGRLVDRILKRELRTELTVEDMIFDEEEFSTLGLKGTIATVKPNRFKQVFTGKLMQEILDKRAAAGNEYVGADESPVAVQEVPKPASAFKNPAKVEEPKQTINKPFKVQAAVSKGKASVSLIGEWASVNLDETEKLWDDLHETVSQTSTSFNSTTKGLDFSNSRFVRLDETMDAVVAKLQSMGYEIKLDAVAREFARVGYIRADLNTEFTLIDLGGEYGECSLEVANGKYRTFEVVAQALGYSTPMRNGKLMLNSKYPNFDGLLHQLKIYGTEKVAEVATTQSDETVTYKTKDGLEFDINGRKLTFKKDMNFAAIMQYVFGWFNTEFKSIDDKRQFVHQYEDVTENFIGVLQNMSITEAISKKVSEQFDKIISDTHRKMDLSSTMYDRNISAPEWQISNYREFVGNIEMRTDGSISVLFTSTTGPFVKSVQEQFGSADFQTNENTNHLRVILDGNFNIKEFDAGLVGKFLKASDDNYAASTQRNNPVKVFSQGKVTFRPSQKDATLSLTRDVACYLVGLESLEQQPTTSSSIRFDNINTLSEFYDLCDVLDDYDFEGNYLKAFRCSKYINDAKANGGELKVAKNGKEISVSIQEDMIFINLTGFTLPKRDTILWKDGDDSVFIRTYQMGSKKIYDSLVILDYLVDKELSSATQSDIPKAVVNTVHAFHFEHQKGGFKIVTEAPLATMLLLSDLQLDLTDNGDGSVYAKLSHFSKTVGTKKQVVNALTAAGYTEGEHVATPGSAASVKTQPTGSSTTTPDEVDTQSSSKIDVIAKELKNNRNTVVVIPNTRLQGRITRITATLVLSSSGKGKYILDETGEIVDVSKYISSAAAMERNAKSIVSDVVNQTNQNAYWYVGDARGENLQGAYVYGSGLTDTPDATKPNSINWSTSETALKGQYFKDSNYKVVNMKVDDLISRQANDFRVDANNETNRIKGRAERALAHITSGAPMDMPVVEIDAQGNLQVVDGRHRIAVAKEMGLKEIPVFLNVAPKTTAEFAVGDKVAVNNMRSYNSMSTVDTAEGVIEYINGDIAHVKIGSGMTMASFSDLQRVEQAEPKASVGTAKFKYSINIDANIIVIKSSHKVVTQLDKKYQDLIKKYGAYRVATMGAKGASDRLLVAFDKNATMNSIQMAYDYIISDLGQPSEVAGPVADLSSNYNKYEIDELFQSMLKKGTPFVFAKVAKTYASTSPKGVVLFDADGNGRFFDVYGGFMTARKSVDWSNKFDVDAAFKRVVADLASNGIVGTSASIYRLSFDVNSATVYNKRSTMNEGIKEDLTGEPTKVNKVEKALVESAMRRMGIYQSAFAYGSSTFVTTLNEGVIDILPTNGNIDHLCKMLGIKLGAELVIDERGGLCLNIV